MKIGLFDSHCHLNTKSEYKNLAEIQKIINDCIDQNVLKMVCCGTTMKDSKEAVELSYLYEIVYSAGGLHPVYVSKTNFLSENDLNKIEKWFKFNKKFVAIGEIGLDYTKENFNNEIKKLQKKEFIKQLNLAKKLKAPVIIHTRGAHNDTIEILKKYKMLKFVIHYFQGNKKQAKDYLNLGCYISFSGIITFSNAQKLLETAKTIPLNKIMVETDSPYSAPQIFRGLLNYPYYVKYVVQKLAKLHSTTVSDMTRITFNNSCEFFDI